MTRALLPNFGFEYEISGRPLPRPARALEQRFAYLLRIVPGWEDVTLEQGECVDELLCWGWSERALKLCPDGADFSAVQRANDKCFSHDVERQLGTALDGAQIVDSVDEFVRAAERHGHAWVLKHPFGVAGRDQVRGTSGTDVPLPQIERLLASGGRAVFEPLLPVEREFSLHFDCEADGVVFVGAVHLFADPQGTFRGNRTASAADPHLVEQGTRAAQLVAELGYRGPVGIDGFAWNAGVRPITEINARWTFGRLTLELSRRLGAELSWHHGPASERPANLAEVSMSPGAGCWLLPGWCDPEGRSDTWIEVAPEDGEIDGSDAVC